MILLDIHELKIIGVEDRNIPNKERIVIQPTIQVNLAQFGLFLGHRHPNDTVTPLPDQFFWFGEVTIQPLSWIFVYTGPGKFRQTTEQNTGAPAYVFHWGKQTTVLGHQDIAPTIFRLDGILIAPRT